MEWSTEHSTLCSDTDSPRRDGDVSQESASSLIQQRPHQQKQYTRSIPIVESLNLSSNEDKESSNQSYRFREEDGEDSFHNSPINTNNNVLSEPATESRSVDYVYSKTGGAKAGSNHHPPRQERKCRRPASKVSSAKSKNASATATGGSTRTSKSCTKECEVLRQDYEASRHHYLANLDRSSREFHTSLNADWPSDMTEGFGSRLTLFDENASADSSLESSLDDESETVVLEWDGMSEVDSLNLETTVSQSAPVILSPLDNTSLTDPISPKGPYEQDGIVESDPVKQLVEKTLQVSLDDESSRIAGVEAVVASEGAVVVDSPPSPPSLTVSVIGDVNLEKAAKGVSESKRRHRNPEIFPKNGNAGEGVEAETVKKFSNDNSSSKFQGTPGSGSSQASSIRSSRRSKGHSDQPSTYRSGGSNVEVSSKHAPHPQEIQDAIRRAVANGDFNDARCVHVESNGYLLHEKRGGGGCSGVSGGGVGGGGCSGSGGGNGGTVVSVSQSKRSSKDVSRISSIASSECDLGLEGKVMLNENVTLSMAASGGGERMTPSPSMIIQGHTADTSGGGGGGGGIEEEGEAMEEPRRTRGGMREERGYLAKKPVCRPSVLNDKNAIHTQGAGEEEEGGEEGCDYRDTFKAIIKEEEEEETQGWYRTCPKLQYDVNCVVNSAAAFSGPIPPMGGKYKRDSDLTVKSDEENSKLFVGARCEKGGDGIVAGGVKKKTTLGNVTDTLEGKHLKGLERGGVLVDLTAKPKHKPHSSSALDGLLSSKPSAPMANQGVQLTGRRKLTGGKRVKKRQKRRDAAAIVSPRAGKRLRKKPKSKAQFLSMILDMVGPDYDDDDVMEDGGEESGEGSNDKEDEEKTLVGADSAAKMAVTTSGVGNAAARTKGFDKARSGVVRCKPGLHPRKKLRIKRQVGQIHGKMKRKASAPTTATTSIITATTASAKAVVKPSACIPFDESAMSSAVATPQPPPTGKLSSAISIPESCFDAYSSEAISSDYSMSRSSSFLGGGGGGCGDKRVPGGEGGGRDSVNSEGSLEHHASDSNDRPRTSEKFFASEDDTCEAAEDGADGGNDWQQKGRDWDTLPAIMKRYSTLNDYYANKQEPAMANWKEVLDTNESPSTSSTSRPVAVSASASVSATVHVAYDDDDDDDIEEKSRQPKRGVHGIRIAKVQRRAPSIVQNERLQALKVNEPKKAGVQSEPQIWSYPCIDSYKTGMEARTVGPLQATRSLSSMKSFIIEDLSSAALDRQKRLTYTDLLHAKAEREINMMKSMREWRRKETDGDEAGRIGDQKSRKVRVRFAGLNVVKRSKSNEDKWNSTVNEMLLKSDKVLEECEGGSKIAEHKYPRSDSARVVGAVPGKTFNFLNELLEQDYKETRSNSNESNQSAGMFVCPLAYEDECYERGNAEEEEAELRKEQTTPTPKPNGKEDNRKVDKDGTVVIELNDFYQYSNDVPAEIPLQRLPKIDVPEERRRPSSHHRYRQPAALVCPHPPPMSASILKIQTAASEKAQERAFIAHRKSLLRPVKTNPIGGYTAVDSGYCVGQVSSPSVPQPYSNPARFGRRADTMANRTCGLRYKQNGGDEAYTPSSYTVALSGSGGGGKPSPKMSRRNSKATANDGPGANNYLLGQHSDVFNYYVSPFLRDRQRSIVQMYK